MIGLAFGRAWWKAGVGAAIVAGPCFLLGQCDGSRRAENRIAAAQAVAVQNAMKTDAAAKAAASDERLADEREVSAITKDLTDAVAAVPDQVPDPVAVQLGCQRLRNAGQDVSDLPACSGPEGRAKAGSAP